MRTRLAHGRLVVAFTPPDVLTGACSDDLHGVCPGHLVGAPCVCTCHTPPTRGVIAMAAASTSTRKKSTTARPTAAKKPADRKPPAPAKPKVVRHAHSVDITYRGVTVTITEDATNDYELLEDANSGDAARLPTVLRRLVGDEGHDLVKEACRNPETGRVLLEGEGSISEYVTELFGALSPS